MKLNYYNSLLVVAAVGIFYTNVPLYLDENHLWQLFEAPKGWVLMLCLLSLPVLIRQMTTGNGFNPPLTIWCLGYAWVTMLWFFPFSQSDTAWHEVRARFFAIIQILTFLTIFRETGATRLARKVLVGGVLLAVAVNIYELFVPMSFNEQVGRSAGLYMNPNMAGEALVLGMILSVTVLEPRYRGPYILLTGIGILTTFSRGGILTWVVAVAGLMLVRGISLKDFLLPVLLGVALGILVVLPRLDQLLTTWERTGVLNANVLTRLEWLTDPSGVSDQSSWERKYLVRQAWDNIAESPFLGSGTGASSQAFVPPHNQYLAFMLDHGLIGVIILPLLILAAMWGVRGETMYVTIVFGCVIMMLGFFSHTILKTGYNLLLISLMAAMSRNQESQRTVITERKESVAARGLVSA